jgi:hypothetical protein
MRTLRRVGAAAVLAVVLVSGCSSGEAPADDVGAGAVTPTPEPVPEVSESPVFPAGPEGDVDRKAYEEGWEYDYIYESASDVVDNYCPELEGRDGAQWLADRLPLEGDEQAILEFGVPLMCPERVSVLEKALRGDFARAFGDGSYEVVKGAEGVSLLEDEGEILPGTYRTEGDLEDCYWERTTKGGDIIDNQFATAARSITVTVKSGESFTARDCGTWKPVG